MLSRVGRSEHDKLAAIFANDFGKVITVIRRHVPSAAVRAIVIAHARPFIGPLAAAPCAFVVIAIPSHLNTRRWFSLANDNIPVIRNPENLDLLEIAAVDEFLAGHCDSLDRGGQAWLQTHTRHQG